MIYIIGIGLGIVAIFLLFQFIIIPLILFLRDFLKGVFGLIVIAIILFVLVSLCVMFPILIIPISLFVIYLVKESDEDKDSLPRLSDE